MDGGSTWFLLFRGADGQWYAAPPGFQTLLRHPIGRGRTRLEAVDALLAHPEFVHRAKMGEWSPEPSLADFVETRAPRWTTWAAFRGIDLPAEGAYSAPGKRQERGNAVAASA
jgi:hypothetical protein